MEILSYDFMIRAMIAAFFTGLAAPVVGTYLVQRRLALLGDGIGHVAVTGVALGLLTGPSPTWTSVAVAINGAAATEVIPRQELVSVTFRARVLQLVYISMGAVPSKKKHLTIIPSP